VEELNEKLTAQLAWYNNRRMAVLGFISPIQRFASFAPDSCDA